MSWIFLSSIRKSLHLHKQALLYLFLPWTTFFTYLWSQMLIIRPDGLYAGHPYVWADWSLHIGLASSFVNKPVFQWFTNHLLYSGEPLNYPFVTNLISALLMKMGVSLQLAFLIPSLIFSILLVTALYVFFLTMSSKKVLAVIASNIFLLSGGVGFFITAYTSKSLSFLLDTSLTMTQESSMGIEFTNVLLGMLIPQRAFLLGMPLGLFILTVLYRIYKAKEVSPVILMLAGLLAGALPIIHTHTFLLIVFLSFWLCVPTFLRQTKQWLYYGVPAVCLSAFVFFTFLSSTVSGSSFFSFHPGWYVQSGFFDWILFWLKNWGLLLPLALIGVTLCIRTQRTNVYLIASWFVVFILANLFQFQPQTWDNSKLLAWSYVGLSYPVAVVIQAIYHWKYTQTHLGKYITALCVFILCASGAVDLLQMLDFDSKTHRLVSTEEIRLGEYIQKNTEPSAVFLTSDWVTNPVTIIGGRSIVLGYTGWIFNYGFPYQQREADIARIYAGGDDTQSLLRLYNVSYVLIGANERKYTPNQEYFETHFERVFHNEGGTIYKVF